jgi:AraC family transcriptional regulator
MNAQSQKLLRLLAQMTRHDDGDVALASLSKRAGNSSSHFHRTFKAFTGETPKRLVQRVRLERAAVKLATSRSTILEIALAAGFESHEVFLRAFRRQFGVAPSAFRATARIASGEAGRHREVMRSVGPCIGLYRVSLSERRERKDMPTTAVERRVLASEQPILFIQRRIPFADLQSAMAQCYGELYGHAHKTGLAVAGHPIARYISTGTGLWTVDFVMPLSAPADASGNMRAGTLAAGPVAFAVHIGPYDQLSQTYAAIEQWAETEGCAMGQSPWEWYVTDPGETPDPAEWRTEIYWPLKA